MSDDLSNPYESPKEVQEGIAPSQPWGPPISPVRLFLGLGLISVCWSWVWWTRGEGNGVRAWFWLLFLVIVPWAVDPIGRLRLFPLHRRNLPWIVLGITSGIALTVFTGGTQPRSSLDHAMGQAAALIVGWLVSCGVLMLAWWKRRNNPAAPRLAGML